MTELHELSIEAVETRFLARSVKQSDYLAALIARLAAYATTQFAAWSAIEAVRAKAAAIEVNTAYDAGAPRPPPDGVPVRDQGRD